MVPPGNIAKLRAAERAAKEAKLRIWAGFVAGSGSGSTAIEGDSFSGTVVEVVSGDTLVVRPSGGGPKADRRVSLSSVRAPRSTQKSPEAWGYDAKEFLRGRAIGQEVSVTMDYSRRIPPREGASEGHLH